MATETLRPVSEFNIWADPEAAEAVFASEMPKTMVGWDISRKHAVIDDREADELRSIGTRAAEVAVECQATLRRFCEETTGLDGFDLPDPIAMAVAISEQTVKTDKRAAVMIVTNDGPTRGLAIVDDRNYLERPKTHAGHSRRGQEPLRVVAYRRPCSEPGMRQLLQRSPIDSHHDSVGTRATLSEFESHGRYCVLKEPLATSDSYGKGPHPQLID